LLLPVRIDAGQFHVSRKVRTFDVQECTAMDWDGLQVFLAVARAGRISAAARRLQVEHTTVSRRLAALENDLGVPLFYRTTRGYLLTPHGENVLANAEAMEREALTVAARAREGSGAVAGLVRLALAPEFASHWVAPRLAAFKNTHPDIELQILVGTRQRDLSRGEAELAVQSPRPRQQGVVAVRLARASAALYASKNFIGGRRLRIHNPGDAKGLPLLVYTSAFQLLQEARWFQPVLESGDVVLATNSTHALLAAARADVGVAVIPRFVARWHDDLVEVSDPVSEHDVWLITHPEFRRDPKVRVTADFLKRIASGPGGIC
jgi:DNA-binding transcriptional LysR family regulator